MGRTINILLLCAMLLCMVFAIHFLQKKYTEPLSLQESITDTFNGISYELTNIMSDISFIHDDISSYSIDINSTDISG